MLDGELVDRCLVLSGEGAYGVWAQRCRVAASVGWAVDRQRNRVCVVVIRSCHVTATTQVGAPSTGGQR
jgi:hypothetical protein